MTLGCVGPFSLRWLFLTLLQQGQGCCLLPLDGSGGLAPPLGPTDTGGGRLLAVPQGGGSAPPVSSSDVARQVEGGELLLRVGAA